MTVNGQAYARFSVGTTVLWVQLVKLTHPPAVGSAVRIAVEDLWQEAVFRCRYIDSHRYEYELVSRPPKGWMWLVHNESRRMWAERL